MIEQLSLTNFYEIINGALDGYHFDLTSFQFNDFPDWVQNKNSVIMYVNSMEENTPDLIAYVYYKDETLFWIICLANKIMNPFEELPIGKKLYIPTLETVISYLTQKSSNNESTQGSTNTNKVVSLN